jgi:hypothetical protein
MSRPPTWRLPQFAKTRIFALSLRFCHEWLIQIPCRKNVASPAIFARHVGASRRTTIKADRLWHRTLHTSAAISSSALIPGHLCENAMKFRKGRVCRNTKGPLNKVLLKHFRCPSLLRLSIPDENIPTSVYERTFHSFCPESGDRFRA